MAVIHKMLTIRQQTELGFWRGIEEKGIRGFSPDRWRLAHIHFKQYSLMYIDRPISNLKDKVVVEIGCGPAGIIPFIEANEAISIDQLAQGKTSRRVLVVEDAFSNQRYCESPKEQVR